MEAPQRHRYFADAPLDGLLHECTCCEWRAAIPKELEARQQPGYFHLIPALQQAVDGKDWPKEPGEELFIATPRRGIETELTELLLLESLVEEAESGDEHARLLLQHIEEECGAPVAEIIQAQRSKLEIMLEDQKNQLMIHAEAVKRHEERGRLLAVQLQAHLQTVQSSSDPPPPQSRLCSLPPIHGLSIIAARRVSTLSWLKVVRSSLRSSRSPSARSELSDPRW
jgi:hypothetical protein